MVRPTIVKPSRGAIGERLWRLRKDHRSIEAIVRAHSDSKGVSLNINYNGEATYSRQWPTYELAAREADVRLRDFLLQGWSTHW
jgi:hypothetical protein